ncbi:MAG TPA: hypothetical protein VFA44_11445 [Gaiellaceae bacterium]|nr:hypothetical protein [Gaiellaceae bacterium]
MLVLFGAGFGAVAAPGFAAAGRGAWVPGWGDPGSCYYGANSKCWVYSHPADQGRTACRVADISYDPGHVGPGGYSRQAATEIANIADREGYQWAGGCFDNNDADPTWNVYPRETKSTLGEGPDCSGLVWRVWRESNYANPSNNSFYFWPRSLYDHGPYDTSAFKSPNPAAPHQRMADKAKAKMMDALVSASHIALFELRIDQGAELYWEALGEAYGTDEFVESYMANRAFSGTFRKAWR